MFYLIRHGLTAWNLEARFQGRSDSPLTDVGREQGERIGRRLAGELDLAPGASLPAYVSPLGRTRATAALVAAHVPLAITFEPRLMEIGFGAWEGMKREEILARYAPDQADRPIGWQFRAPGGESLEQALARVRSWLAEARGPAVIVSHGLIGRLLRGVYAGLPAEEMLALPVPQDGYFRLHGGRIDFVRADS